MSDPDGVETNVAAFSEYLERATSLTVYRYLRDIQDQSQDMLIIREALLRLFRATFLSGKELL
jgi:hypothetical protein